MEDDKSLKLKRIQGILAVIAIAGFGFWVNRAITIKGLYMDDLYMWSCYGEQSLMEFAFPVGTSTRFRPVYWLATYLQMAIIGTHVSWFVPFNVICNIIVALVIYGFASRLSGIRLTGLAAAICYLASRFAYYQIGQALGLMETMALLFAVCILYLLWRYMEFDSVKSLFRRIGKIRVYTERSADPFYYAALLLYFLLAFVHERYIALLPLFFYAAAVRMFNERASGRLPAFISPAVTAAVIMIIRRLAIGKAVPAGTGGTQVTETFSIRQAAGYAVDQIMYIFGVNSGPEYLNGLPWENVPRGIKLITAGSAGIIACLCIIFIYVIIKELRAGDEKIRKEAVLNIETALLFILFIKLCVLCSSVTIRLEMRWIYVSYAAALMFAAFMTGAAAGYARYREMRPAAEGKDAKDGWAAHSHLKTAAACLFTAYAVLSVYTNVFYRASFDRLYFWADQQRMNSLYEQTIGKYGRDGVFGKKIYILENSYGMSDFYGRTFFKPYDKNKKAEGTEVIFIESADDAIKAEIAAGTALLIKEVPEENAYEDISLN